MIFLLSALSATPLLQDGANCTTRTRLCYNFAWNNNNMKNNPFHDNFLQIWLK